MGVRTLYGNMCKCVCECNFECNRKCGCNVSVGVDVHVIANVSVKEKIGCVQGFSTSMSLVNMCAWLSCHRDASLFDRSHVTNNPDTQSIAS